MKLICLDCAGRGIIYGFTCMGTRIVRQCQGCKGTGKR